MTRANLNFVWQNRGEAPRTLFHYHNGDQYPEGLLQHFGIEEFLTIPHLWTPEDFRAWIAKNYRKSCRKVSVLSNGMKVDAHADTEEPAEPTDLGEGGQPRIYYTDGFVTDYSYVFTNGFRLGRPRKDGGRHSTEVNWVTAWNWDQRIFSGTAERFLRFLEKRVKPTALPGDVAVFSAVELALGAVDNGKAA
jgi:hypothetical protein